MRKRIFLALLTVLLCLAAPAALADDLIRISIKVVNSGEGNISDPITIYDPDGTQVAQWGSLALGQSQSWQGTWNVTQEQLDAGRLRYSVAYTTYDDEANPVPTTSTASVTVQKESAAPGLTASYTISPTVAQEGQEVKLTYTLSNTGNVDLTHVRITNTGIDQKNINIASLGVGEKITKEYTFTMGDKDLTSNPKVTYQAKDSDTVLTYAKMAKKTIEVAEGGLEAELTSDAPEEGAKPGDTVTLTLTLKNTSNLTYSKLAVQDETLGEIESGIEVKPGETKEIKKEIIAENAGDYQFSVTGETSSGNALELSSNEVSVNPLDMEKVVNLEVSADTETLVMYQEPAVVRFAVTVKNTGSVEGKNLKVLCGKTQIATIETLAPGEETTIVKDLAASVGGTFQFSVVSPAVEAAEGVEAQSEMTYESNTLRIAYQEPTAPPTRVPATQEPAGTVEPVATEEPERAEEGSVSLGFILLCGFAVLLVAALIAVFVLILMGRKQQTHEAVVLDSYERSNARDYMVDSTTRRRADARRRNAEREQAKRLAQEEQAEAPQDADMEEADAQEEAQARGRRASRRVMSEEDENPAPADDYEAYKRPQPKAEEDELAEALAAAEAAVAEKTAADEALPEALAQDATVKIDRQMVEQIRRGAAEHSAAEQDMAGKTGKYDLKTLHERMAAEGKVDLSEDKGE